MKKLKVVEKDKYNYILECNNKRYQLNIEFYNLEKNPSIGDYLYIDESILRENTFYSFGLINNKDSNVSSKDIIKVLIDDKEIFMQRYYG